MSERRRVRADPSPRSAGLARQFVHSQEVPAEAKAAREEPSASSVARRKHHHTFVSGRLAGRRFNFRDLAIATLHFGVESALLMRKPHIGPFT
jgi:hypothetical protein